MSKDMQIKVSEYYIQNQESTGSRYIRQRTAGNQQGTRPDKPRRPFRVHSTFIQQEKVQKATRTMKMRPQNQLYKRSAKGTQC